MKSKLLLLCITGLFACSGDSKKETSTPKEEKPNVVDSATADKHTVLTDQEKAKITEAFLVFNVKELLRMNSDDCATLENSMQLLYAKQIIYNRFPSVISASPDINELLTLLETKIQANSCKTSNEPDITVDVRTEGGQSSYKIQVPTETALWAILSSEQRKQALEMVAPKSKNKLLTMETRYAAEINNIKKHSSVKKKPSAELQKTE